MGVSLLQIFDTFRGEQFLIELLDCNLLFLCRNGQNTDDPVLDHATFSKKWERLFGESFTEVKAIALTTDEHSGFCGTLIEAWASHMSVRREEVGHDLITDGLGRNARRDFRRENRSNERAARR